MEMQAEKVNPVEILYNLQVAVVQALWGKVVLIQELPGRVPEETEFITPTEPDPI
jgi:hypothetical protein